jgi:hypothetical protein
LVVVVERVIPPRAILFLTVEEHGGELFGVVFLALRGQEPHGLGEVVDAVVVEVTGNLEMGFVRDRSLAADAEKTPRV